ncbi:secreted RxLR effector protein 161-like [Pistacia vera]|uniref:secreted RxLR effector protein 161-like n=1 Tax=Pistacia vera TaxID=55513 RepID=UPI0012631456|nr:secreted RxLR effector protein 161-like [Pistacia vera]
MKDCNSVLIPTKLGLKLTKNGTTKKVDATFYKKIVGNLMYLTSIRPYIMHAISLISRYNESPTEIHLLAVKRIFCYLKGIADFRILYKNGGESSLIGFSDNDYARDIDDRKSTSGFVFMSNSGPVTWSSKNNR